MIEFRLIYGRPRLELSSRLVAEQSDFSHAPNVTRTWSSRSTPFLNHRICRDFRVNRVVGAGNAGSYFGLYLKRILSKANISC